MLIFTSFIFSHNAFASGKIKRTKNIIKTKIKNVIFIFLGADGGCKGKQSSLSIVNFFQIYYKVFLYYM